MHLTPEELLDLAEGARAESAAPHLESCAACREHVAALRATMSLAADVDLAEPSPLFWDHLSRRVREAVDAEDVAATTHSAAGWTSSWRTWALAGAVAAAVMIATYVAAPSTPHPSAPSDQAAASAPLEPLGAADDPSLILFAQLTEQMDQEAMTDIGWSNSLGGVDAVVTGLSDEERQELQRLLAEELAKS